MSKTIYKLDYKSDLLLLLNHIVRKVYCRLWLCFGNYITSSQNVWEKPKMPQKCKLQVKVLFFNQSLTAVFIYPKYNPKQFKWMSDLKIFLTKGLAT